LISPRALASRAAGRLNLLTGFGTAWVEALARWPRRPDGPIAPDDFIEIAEVGGFIQQLGLFVLRRACSEMRDFADCKLSVNISPAQFRHLGFETEIKQVLEETGFPAHRLQLEITEKHLIDHPDRARQAIDTLRALGVKFALDDFGTGFTSIAYLPSYGFDCIKIDRSLVSSLGTDPKARLLISGMVHIANALDLQVIAEGVETSAQATLLRAAGCHALQGYLFGRPAPISELNLDGRMLDAA
jgi:EAL domain-containing protein (putative c-di-GMP-specific phosphodiesterase class I)